MPERDVHTVGQNADAGPGHPARGLPSDDTAYRGENDAVRPSEQGIGSAQEKRRAVQHGVKRQHGRNSHPRRRDGTRVGRGRNDAGVRVDEVESFVADRARDGAPEER